MKYVLAYDFGTGGIKTSLFREDGVSAGYSFQAYDTYFPAADFREQRPADWWQAAVTTTREVIAKTGVNPEDIAALAVSGHSLGAVPIGQNGELLCEFVPVWNDARAKAEAREFFTRTDEDAWYLKTGNGFPAELYSIFKILWYKNHKPDLYRDTAKFIGTKDFINYKLTGVLCTDHSYASGSGVYSLEDCAYNPEYVALSGIDPAKLPEIRKSTDVIGTILPETAAQLGLSAKTKVCCGGVDNACMALGAGCIGDGDVYTSLGTSAWIAVSDSRPVVDTEKRPYVFAHCLPGKYVSATAIFSAGNSLRWVRDRLFADYLAQEDRGGPDAYARMDGLAAESPCGANGLIFLPTLAGGSSLDKSANARGGFAGLDLMHTRADIARAALEGIAINLRLALDVLKQYCETGTDMLIVGGGAKSPLWRQIFADAYHMNVVTSRVAQDAGSFGAAAVAAVGAGLWESLDRVKNVVTAESCTCPHESDAAFYESLLPAYAEILNMQSDIGDILQNLKTKEET